MCVVLGGVYDFMNTMEDICRPLLGGRSGQFYRMGGDWVVKFIGL